MPFMTMEHSVDPAKAINEALGDGIENTRIFNNQVLVAVYVRPKKTASGIYLPDAVSDEDKYQGKVGLVVAKGPTAFVDDEGNWFKDVSVDVGDWVIFRPSDGWSITINNVLCRIIDDTLIRGKIDRPDRVW